MSNGVQSDWYTLPPMEWPRGSFFQTPIWRAPSLCRSLISITSTATSSRRTFLRPRGLHIVDLRSHRCREEWSSDWPDLHLCNLGRNEGGPDSAKPQTAKTPKPEKISQVVERLPIPSLRFKPPICSTTRCPCTLRKTVLVLANHRIRTR